MSSGPVAGQWDFDRQRADDASGLEFTTFSVGVFQWLPARRGLKKSRTIRVLGYVSDPERVFEKAEELCRKLNAEKVDSENLPAWVQKQYSVPRPEDLVIERRHDDLTGSQVRSIRQAVMKRVLLPQGFVKGKGGTYIRRQNDQIHLIDFQAAIFGHQYTVNLGFHYAFLPGFRSHRILEPAHYDLLDCALQERIGFFQPPHLDEWFDYGTDKDALATTLAENAADSLRHFAEYSAKWVDPLIWIGPLNTWPPNRKAPWQVLYPALFRGCLAVHFGLAERARDEFTSFVAMARDQHWEESFRNLVGECCEALDFDPGIAAT